MLDIDDFLNLHIANELGKKKEILNALTNLYLLFKNNILVDKDDENHEFLENLHIMFK